MIETSVTPSAAESIPVGVIADPDVLPALLAACPAAGLRVTALSGAPQSSAPPGVTWFDDTRVLIAQGGATAVLLAGSPRDGVELAALAFDAGLHVWRLPPLGRSFAEATESVLRARGEERRYRIASAWEPIRDHIRALTTRNNGAHPVFSDIHVSRCGPPLASWRASQVDAGGGVLAQHAYAALETLVAMRGLPESVSAATTRCRRRSGQAPRETEDVAGAVMRYETGVAVVRATWDMPPFSTLASHQGPEGGLQLTTERAARFDVAGVCVEEIRLPTEFLPNELARFARELRGLVGPEESQAAIERHLAVSALLEAVYLSARTGQPESPRHRYEVQKWPETRF